MKIIKGIEQGSFDWLKMRQGMVTGTKLADVMGSPLDRYKLISELIAEEGTETLKTLRPTPEMERGSAEEVFAVKAYEAKYGKKVEKATMLISDDMPWFGVSPDGLVKDKKTKKYNHQIEIKNPNSSTMILYKMGNMIEGHPLAKKHFLGVPLDYQWQIVASFLVNEDLETMDFIVYDARFISDDHK